MKGYLWYHFWYGKIARKFCKPVATCEKRRPSRLMCASERRPMWYMSLQDICISNYFAKVHCSNLLCLNVTWYPHKSPIDQLEGYFKGCTLHCIQIFWYFLDGKNVFRSIHYGHAAYNMPPRNIYAAAHNMLPRELNIPIIKSNTWPREPLPNQLTRKLGALELISLF